MIHEHYNLASWFFPFEHFSHGHLLVGILSLIFWILVVYAIFKFISKTYNISKYADKHSPKYATSILVTISAFLLFTSVAYAMCPPGFAPPGRIYHPEDNTHGLLVFEGGYEKLILEPSFTGNATNFGLVLPLPSRPKLNEAPEKLFIELEDLTNPIRSFGGGLGPQSLSVGKSAPRGVRVIEQKDVGDFKTTVLTADSTTALIQWLKENNYQYHPSDEQNFEYYVQKGGYYFVAMKVNMEKAKVDSTGFLKGKLRPIEFSFTTEKPMLPLRSMAGDMEQMTFTLYALASEPYYIPGVDILYSKKASFGDLEVAPSLLKYNAWGQWLVRNEARFDPRKIGQDLFLERGSNSLIVESVSNPKRVNPHLLAANSGIVEGKRGSLTYPDSPTNPPKSGGGFPLLAVMRLVGALIIVGTAFYAFRFWKKRRMTPEVTQSQTEGVQIPEHGTSISFLKPRNAVAGIVSGVATIILTYLIGLLLTSLRRGFAPDIDEAIGILVLIAVGLIYLLFTLGPAIYLAAKHGWRTFISVIIAELLTIVIFVVLKSVFPFWSFIPYLF